MFVPRSREICSPPLFHQRHDKQVTPETPASQSTGNLKVKFLEGNIGQHLAVFSDRERRISVRAETVLSQRMIRINAAMRGGVSQDTESGLSIGDEFPECLIRLLMSRVTRDLGLKPQPVAIHLRKNSSRKRKLPGITEDFIVSVSLDVLRPLAGLHQNTIQRCKFLEPVYRSIVLHSH